MATYLSTRSKFDMDDAQSSGTGFIVNAKQGRGLLAICIAQRPNNMLVEFKSAPAQGLYIPPPARAIHLFLTLNQPKYASLARPLTR